MSINRGAIPVSIEKKAKVFELYKRFLRNAGLILEKQTIADFGCAKGIFLQGLVANNTCHGYDISVSSIELCKKNLQGHGAQFSVLDLNNSHLESDIEYDLMVYFDVLEHLSNFTHIQYIIKHNLKKNGHVVVTTPNANSFMRVLGPARIFSGEADPTHIMLYTPYTLDFFLRRTGLKKTCLSTPFIFYFRNDLITSRVLIGGQIFAVYQKSK